MTFWRLFYGMYHSEKVWYDSEKDVLKVVFSSCILKFGVPQESVLDPLLFTLYTTPLSSMICGHTIPHHLYADDSQLYVSFASGDSAAVLTALQSCLASVQSWMSMNKLKLNPDKTEFLLVGNERQQRKYLSMFPIELFGVKTNPAKSARNLGVIFDKNFTVRSHISTVCSSCFYHLRSIRRHLDLDSAKLLAAALVSSRLDYCTSLLYGIAEIDLTRLHSVYRINWPTWWQSLLHLPAVFHCFLPFIGCQ